MAQYELPENLSALSDDELNAALNAGLDAFKELGISADSDEDTIAEGERIAPLVSAIRAEQQARVAAAEARAQRAAELLATVPEQTAEDTEIVEEAPVAEAEVEVEQEAPTPIENEEAPVAENTPVPVAASTQSPVARAAQNAPEPVVAAAIQPVVALVAAADVSGFAAGQELDDLGVAGQALVSRLKGLPRGMAPSPVRQRFGAAVIRMDHGNLMQGREYDDYSLIQRAGDESRLSGGSLVAAGGWCAPSETLYDMCQMETVSGILDLPEFGVSRGGIRYTPGPDFSEIYSSCGFHQTEAEAIAGECKTCCEVTCPEFDEVRLDAVGMCVKVPILTNAAYPELVRRYIEGALVAHAHKVNAWTISQMNTAAGAGVTVGGTDPISFALDALELQAIGMRYQYRLGENATIEVVAPVFLKALIRMDVARRNGQDWNSVTDAQIESNFSARNIKVQWVYDWQDLAVAGCAVTLPANVSVLMYPAGTWTKGTADVISMDAVYDSVGLESNTFTGIFVEQGVLAVQKCTHTCKVTIPICVSGQTAASELTACLTAAA
jgi:hypothetical protein